MESIASNERFLILGLMFGVVKIFATPHKVDGFILSWPWEFFESLVFLSVGDEV